MTKCIVLGENEPKKKKSIEFTAYIGKITSQVVRENGSLCAPATAYKNIELISRNYINATNRHEDLMFAYDDNRTDGQAYLGHWNDGIV